MSFQVADGPIKATAVLPFRSFYKAHKRRGQLPIVWVLNSPRKAYF